MLAQIDTPTEVTQTTVIERGVGLGAVIAVVASWSRNQSILWAILHGILSWLYVIYFASPEVPGIEVRFMFQKITNTIFALFFIVWGIFSWFHGFEIPFFTKYPGSIYIYSFSVFLIFAPALLLYTVYKVSLELRGKHKKDHVSFIALGFALVSIVSYLILLKVGVLQFQ